MKTLKMKTQIPRVCEWKECVSLYLWDKVSYLMRYKATASFCVLLPEQTDDYGAGEQSDKWQAVTQSRQDPHHPVEDQLETQTEK